MCTTVTVQTSTSINTVMGIEGFCKLIKMEEDTSSHVRGTLMTFPAEAFTEAADKEICTPKLFVR